MCKKFIYLTFFFAFCTTAMASDIAISTQAGWFSQAVADTEMQKIVNNVKGVNIQVFTSAQLDALATWVKDHTGDGTSDLLIMCGNFPATIYPAGNAQPDGSLAELFLDDGNTIINTGDYIFYVGSAGNNDAGGLQNMTDVPGAGMWGDDSLNTRFTPTADGQLYTPSLTTLPSNRPWFPGQFAGTDWEVELILAQSSDGSQIHPAIMHNTVTGGRLGVFFQINDDSPPRGQVISEWINNYWLKFIAAGNPYARSPNPINGATGVVSPLVQWKAGDTGAFHDVYFGTNPTPGPAEFRGRQQWLVYWHGAGITPGTTYYWRIDEVEADGVTIHTGSVWSFTAAPLTAYGPIPTDGAKWVATDADLSWTAGATGIKRDVYFGTSQTDVANGTGGTLKSSQQTTKTYEPGTLALDTTYYWRIDEYNSGGTKFPGNVWSFTTIGPYAGVKAEYYNWTSATIPPPRSEAFKTRVLVRIDPAINFNWGDPGSPDPVVNVDLFSARWVGVVEVQYSEPYIFTTNSDDGIRMWLDDVLIIDSWIDQSPTMHSSSAINLVAGQRYAVRVEYYENAGGAVAQLYWQSTSLARQLVPSGALQLPVTARNPIPVSGAVDVIDTPTLRWTAGDKAAKHNVYFGTDANAVTNATTASAGIYRGQQNLAANTYVPSEAPLAWNSTYYWRIDEVNAAETWKGSIWSFTTANFIVVDDFEDYTDDIGSRIFQTWKDGWGYTEPAPGYSGNGTGSTVGYGQAPFAEQTIVHGGNQSMPLGYDNSGTGGKARYSETFREWASPQDWTRNNVKALALWFYGDPNNAAEQLYVALEDNGAHVKVVNHLDIEAAQKAAWQEWNIELTQFSAAGVNLKAIKKMYIGLGNRTSPKVGGTGTIFIDDIAVYPSRCVPSILRPDADIAEPYDCKVDYRDLRILADEWLSETQLQDWEVRAAYWDGRYATGWADEATTVRVRDGLAAAGYTILDADQLKTWMNARIADKKLSVVVFCRDIAPDTVIETMDAACTLRRYLDAGGKIVWYADWPLYYQGHADATSTTWGSAGAVAILGFNASSGPNDSYDVVVFTYAGTTWGLTTTWQSQRPTSPTITSNLTPLATTSAGSAAAWAKHFVPRDKARGFVRLWDTGGGPSVEDVIRVAESKGALAADLNADKKVDFKDYAKLADAWLEEILWP